MSEETKFVTVEFDKSRLQDVFAGKDGVLYCNIQVTERAKFTRKLEQIRDVEGAAGRKCFSLPENFEAKIKQSIKDETSGLYTDVEEICTPEQLQEYLNNEEVQGFVQFFVPKDNVSEERSTPDGNSYVFVKLDGVGSFIRSTETLHDVNAEYFRFAIPGDSKIKVTKSVRVDGVPDDAPASEKWKSEKVEMSPFDMKVKAVKRAEWNKKHEQEMAQEQPRRKPHSR